MRPIVVVTDHHVSHIYHHDINPHRGLLDISGRLTVTVMDGKVTSAELHLQEENAKDHCTEFWKVKQAVAERVLDLAAEHDGSKPQQWMPSLQEWNDLQTTCAQLKEKVEKLQKFKDYTHLRFDMATTPKEGDPDSPHLKEGCRVGARFDWLVGKAETAFQDGVKKGKTDAVGALDGILHSTAYYHADKQKALLREFRERLGFKP